MTWDDEDLLFGICDNLPNYFLKTSRLKTYNNWPYNKKSTCNIEAMASSYFVAIPTNEYNDHVVCIICWKELDSWDKGDDPWLEHKRHSPTCKIYELINFDLEDLSFEEFMDFYNASITNFTEKIFKVASKKMDENVNMMIKKMEP